MQIFVFGDSISYGAWDSRGGWADRLKEWIHQKNIKSHMENTEFYCPLYNLSIPGNTTTDLLKRFEAEITPRLNEEEGNIIILAIGINDSIIDLKTNQNWTPLEEFEENLGKIMEMAKRYSQKIYFVGLTKVDDKRTNPIAWEKELSYTEAVVKLYDQTLLGFCRDSGVEYLSVPLLSDEELDDGVHPNSLGHERIFEEIKNSLSDILD